MDRRDLLSHLSRWPQSVQAAQDHRVQDVPQDERALTEILHQKNHFPDALSILAPQHLDYKA
ncbi:hypothetical protein RRF57_007762 [Xylaria bambusicola]|uniref:Uncharacterized protein n=1 Tax=Xylaria bambusicola TaxID=326684 RepID=A0AAN7ZAZ2_9PEZI